MAPVRSRGWRVGLSAAFILVAVAAHAQAPNVRHHSGRISAAIVPPEDWCSSVVNVDLRATRSIFSKESDEVQRFVGAVRASIVEDCPEAEIVRIRGYAGAARVFQAYSAKQSGWNIVVLPTASGFLPMLQIKGPAHAMSRELAYLETRALFDRARLKSLQIDTADEGDGTDHLAWRIGEARGATYVVIDRKLLHKTLSDLADTAAHLLAADCLADGTVRNPENGKSATDVQSRTFDCVRPDGTVSTGVIVHETDNIAVILTLYSEFPTLHATLVRLLTDANMVR